MTNTNPAEDWRALTENYRSMNDGELEELALTFNDLTPTAQQVLGDEMRLRGLGDPRAPGWQASADRQPEAGNEESGIAAAQDGSDLSVEYTWKTQLCVCDAREEAWQIAEVLRRAGVESWIEPSNSYSPHSGVSDPVQRVLVAADQLEEARDVISRPIPRDIAEQSKVTVPEYELPKCPKCGAADPALENVDPVNAWKCESCGAEWTEAEPEAGGEG